MDYLDGYAVEVVPVGRATTIESLGDTEVDLYRACKRRSVRQRSLRTAARTALAYMAGDTDDLVPVTETASGEAVATPTLSQAVNQHKTNSKSYVG